MRSWRDMGLRRSDFARISLSSSATHLKPTCFWDPRAPMQQQLPPSVIRRVNWPESRSCICTTCGTLETPSRRKLEDAARADGAHGTPLNAAAGWEGAEAGHPRYLLADRCGVQSRLSRSVVRRRRFCGIELSNVSGLRFFDR